MESGWKVAAKVAGEAHRGLESVKIELAGLVLTAGSVRSKKCIN